MKKQSFIKRSTAIRFSASLFMITIFSSLLLSFTVHKMADDFLKQLGIAKTDADKKITESILGGYLNAYGVKNIKNIATGNRAAIAKDLLAYTKKHVIGTAFIVAYNDLRNNNKPVMHTVTRPEENRKQTIAQNEKSVTGMEKLVKTATAQTKAPFEQALADARKRLKESKDPNNKQLAAYEKNYPELLKMYQNSYDNEIKEWEKKYPANQMQFVKKQLLQFMEETKDIDFTAALTEKSGKKIFVNPAYEKKSYRWKMVFRAGKDVVETSRAFVQNWINEIK
jgi:hypothetical protein